jgi:hypothetical protein
MQVTSVHLALLLNQPLQWFIPWDQAVALGHVLLATTVPKAQMLHYRASQELTLTPLNQVQLANHAKQASIVQTGPCQLVRLSAKNLLIVHLVTTAQAEPRYGIPAPQWKVEESAGTARNVLLVHLLQPLALIAPMSLEPARRNANSVHLDTTAPEAGRYHAQAAIVQDPV